MAPSPSSSLNTPGGVGATPSPQQEDQAYRDKVRQLSKYIEPLRRMIAKMSSEGSKCLLVKINCLTLKVHKESFYKAKSSVSYDKKKNIFSFSNTKM